MRVILHIGNFKTGTTYLQNWLFQNRILLRQQHIFYGVTTEYVNSHIGVGLGILRQVLEETALLGKCPVSSQMTDEDGVLLFDAEADISKIYRMAEMTMCDTVIVSCEGFFADFAFYAEGMACLLDEEELSLVRQGIRAKLYEFFPEAEVVCYLRRQDIYLDAMYREYCKVPWTAESAPCSFSAFYEKNKLCLSYLSEVRGWQQLFGVDKCYFLPYEREKLYQQDIVADFFYHCFGWKEEKTASYRPVSSLQSNYSLSADATAFLLRHSEISESGMHRLKLYSDAHPDTVPYLFLEEWQQTEILRQHEKENEELAELGCRFSECGDIQYRYTGLSPEREREIAAYITTI